MDYNVKTVSTDFSGNIHRKCLTMWKCLTCEKVIKSSQLCKLISLSIFTENFCMVPFWAKNALFLSEMRHMLYHIVLYCIAQFFYCIAWYIFCYLMVLHGIALYDLVSYVIYFACFCVFPFVALAVSRKTPTPFFQGGFPNLDALLMNIRWSWLSQRRPG